MDPREDEVKKEAEANPPRTCIEAFKVLGLLESASEEEINKRYYKLMLQWHPDRWVNASEEEQVRANRKSQEITVAHGLLTGKITEQFIQQQPNNDWINKLYEQYNEFDKFCKKCYGKHYWLLFALIEQNLTKTKILLKEVENINTQFGGSDSESILHCIVKNSCKNPQSGWSILLEEILLKYGANTLTPAIEVNIMGRYGTPLYVACELGNLDVVNMLLKYKADPNKHNIFVPLHIAIKENRADIVEALIRRGAKTEKLDYREFNQSIMAVFLPCISDKKKAFHYIFEKACKDPNWVECLKEILFKYNSNKANRIIDVNSSNSQNDTPLCVACKQGNLEVVNVLLEYGADPNISRNRLPLYYALYGNKPDIVEALIRRGAKIEKLDYKGFDQSEIKVFLRYAPNKQKVFNYIVERACNGPSWVECLEEVLSKYSTNNSAIDVNIIGGDSKTPLYFACELGNLDVVNLLLRYDANPNIHDASCIPLHYALKENKINIAKALLEHGAQTEEFNSYEIIKFSRGAVEVLLPNLSSTTKNLMLHHIAAGDSMETNHDIEIAKLLLGAGVDPKFCIQAEIGKSSSSALHCAKLKGKGKLVKLFNGREENSINNDLHYVQQPITENTTHNFPQKQSSRGKWMIIVPALLCSAIGATLATMGIIPQIAAIGVIATAVLSGIAGAIVGGVAGYLVDVTISQCCSNQQCAA